MKTKDSQRSAIILLLLGATAMSFLLHWGTGRWLAQWQPDTDSYLTFDWSSNESIFRGIRTPGYPLFLAMITGVLGTSGVPFAHWVALVAAVALWHRGLRCIGFRELSAFCASAPLLFSTATWDLGNSITSDSLGITLCIGACGLFLSAMAHPARGWNWVALGIATLAAILVRPAYMFLLPLWPIAAGWFAIMVLKADRTERLRTMACAGVAAIVPFLGYCGLRAVMVGEFGLVSFAGYNLIGVTGQFITPEDLNQFQGREHDVATRMLSKRQSVVDYAPPDSYETMVRLYNATVWGTAAPAAQEVFGNDVEGSNDVLKSIAITSLSLHRREYLMWLLRNGKSMIEQLLRGTLTDFGSRLAVAGLAVGILTQALFPAWLRRWLTRMNGRLSENLLSPSTEWRWLWWLCLAVISAKGLLVILVEPALGRYVAAVGCLIPSLVGWICGHLVETVAVSNSPVEA
ncbi:MAG: hypothetical protein ACK553_08670 [Planctomycetota bacterium]|jgi:hypothetical protein